MRTYTKEEKQAIIDRFMSGELSANILADTGIPKSTFYGWLRTYREEQEADKRKTVNIRNFHLLENKVARLESIVDILKSATCTAKSPLKQRLYAAEELYGKYNIHVICDAFEFLTEHSITTFSATRGITRGMQNVVRTCGFAYRKFSMRTIRFLVLPKSLPF